MSLYCIVRPELRRPLLPRLYVTYTTATYNNNNRTEYIYTQLLSIYCVHWMEGLMHFMSSALLQQRILFFVYLFGILEHCHINIYHRHRILSAGSFFLYYCRRTLTRTHTHKHTHRRAQTDISFSMFAVAFNAVSVLAARMSTMLLNEKLFIIYNKKKRNDEKAKWREDKKKECEENSKLGGHCCCCCLTCRVFTVECVFHFLHFTFSWFRFLSVGYCFRFYLFLFFVLCRFFIFLFFVSLSEQKMCGTWHKKSKKKVIAI